ncbi:MAG TPA: hypothetical protein VHX86_02115 [Tepidisphaeraceae bacterium]|nr:hypothetical protein [Tepidisphaeraceae bacterium]
MASTSSISLIVATLGLQEVQSVLAAIRTADLQSAARLSGGVAAAQPCDRYCPGSISPQARYLPRPVIHPTPRYLPRPVIHPQPRIEPQCPPRPETKAPNITPPPPSPWKTLPWQEPVPAPNVIKMIIRPPDIAGKGMLIDLFL